MAIPESIKQKANKIRNEVYGKDVREALASGIEEVGDIADQTRERQDSVEAQFQSVLDETTGKDVISAPEITAARVGADDTNHPNLKERLDTEYQKLSSQLAQIATQVEERTENEIYDNERIQRAIDKLSSSGGNVYLTKGDYILDPNESIVIPSNVNLVGSGMHTTTLHSNTRRTVKMIEIKGDNVIIEGIGFDLHEYDNTSNLTEISCVEINDSCENVMITKCKFQNGYAGVWLNPINGAQISNIKIKDSLFFKLRHNIYIGHNKFDSEERTDNIFDVLIDGNIIKDGLYDGDGIKTIQRCSNLVITNNVITNHERDAIDLYTSGDNVIISHNILSRNGDKGIDIKDYFTPTYPSEVYGYNRRIIITNNIIDDNLGHGIGVAWGGVYLVNISNNLLTGNQRNAIMVFGSNINITGNMIYQNCLLKGERNAGIYVYGDETGTSKNVNISNNTILNNGNDSEAETTGIRLFTRVEESNISNNTISNDSGIENAFQQVGLFVGDLCNGITVKNNKVNGHIRDVWIKRNARIVGETARISIGSHEISTGYIDIDALFLGERISVTDVAFVNGSTIEANTDTYLSLRLRKRVDGVLDISNLAVPETTQNDNFEAYKPVRVYRFDDTDISIDRNKIKPNETLVLTLQAVGGTISIKDAVAIVRYVSY